MPGGGKESSMDLATWSDLPIEILDQILCLSDTPTLLSLSKLNHTLNRLALEHLFKRENVTNPKQGYIDSRLASKQVVPALNAALWIKHLPHVTYYLNPDVKRLFDEVEGLKRLVQRVRANERLDLYFSSVDRWFADGGLRDGEGEVTRISAVRWRKIFVGLLEGVLRRGCRSMRVEGGHRLSLYYVDYPPMDNVGESTVPTATATEGLVATTPAVVVAAPAPVLEVSVSSGTVSTVALGRLSVGRKLIRWVRKRLGLKVSRSPRPTMAPPIPVLQTPAAPLPQAPQTPIPLAPPLPKANPPPTSKPVSSIPDETAVTSFQTSSPCLAALNLRSSMMMQPLFFQHTLNLLQNHSSTLRHLEIVSIKIAKSIWKSFFSNLTLPVLEEFIYLYDTLVVEEPYLTPRLLLNFFIRHPTIRTLELYGISTTGTFPPINPTLLPNLTHLDAHPKIVSWLLQHPTSHPNLHFVSLTSEYITYRLSFMSQFNPYDDTFDNGILTLSTLTSPPSSHTPRTTTTTSTNQPIHVQFKFSTERDLLTWFLTHITLGHTNSSPIQRLEGVERLTISAHYHTRFEVEHRDVIPRWLKLFPSLRRLEMVELAYPDEVRSEGFVRAVREAVPELETWIVGRQWVVGRGGDEVLEE